jgi:hypothetical protein
VLGLLSAAIDLQAQAEGGTSGGGKKGMLSAAVTCRLAFRRCLQQVGCRRLRAGRGGDFKVKTLDLETWVQGLGFYALGGPCRRDAMREPGPWQHTEAVVRKANAKPRRSPETLGPWLPLVVRGVVARCVPVRRLAAQAGRLVA